MTDIPDEIDTSNEMHNVTFENLFNTFGSEEVAKIMVLGSLNSNVQGWVFYRSLPVKVLLVDDVPFHCTEIKYEKDQSQPSFVLDIQNQAFEKHDNVYDTTAIMSPFVDGTSKEFQKAWKNFYRRLSKPQREGSFLTNVI